VIFAIYAALVLYFAVKYRRRWPAFLAVFLGVLLLGMLNRLLSAEGSFFGYQTSHLVLLLWAETGIVGGLGLYAACLPRSREELDCRRCGYNLQGLEPSDLKCPECGTLWRGKGSGLEHDDADVTLTPVPRVRKSFRRGI